MNMIATELLDQLAALDVEMEAQHEIIKKARRGAMGLTLEDDKTPEWKEAKRKYATAFAKSRQLGQQINKLRKFVRYEKVNGKCTAIYKYK